MLTRLDDRHRDVMDAFRAWIESAAEGELGLTGGRRYDRRDERTLATHWPANGHLWYEIAVLPFLPQVRVAMVTDDPYRSRDFERMIEDSGNTRREFVALGFRTAGLDWREPPVEHYCERGTRFFFATPLDLDTIDRLAEAALREKVLKMLAGYRHAFSGTATA